MQRGMMPPSNGGRGSTKLRRLRTLLLSAIVIAAGLQWIGGEAAWVGMRHVPMHGRTARCAVDDLKIGEEVTGTVTSFHKIGAKLDLGLELPGFVHISHLSRDRVKKPEDILSIGDKVTARVLHVKTATSIRSPAEIRVSIAHAPVFDKDIDSLNALKPGEEVTGSITGFNKVGAILDLGLPFPGFLHVRQMTEDRNKKAEDLYSIGDTVTARIRQVSGDHDGEIELSMRD